MLGSGGAVAVRASSVSLRRVSFLSNEASWRGGAISAAGDGGVRTSAAARIGRADSGKRPQPEAAAFRLRLEGDTRFLRNAAARGESDVQLCAGAELTGGPLAQPEARPLASAGAEGGAQAERSCADGEAAAASSVVASATPPTVASCESDEEADRERQREAAGGAFGPGMMQALECGCEALEAIELASAAPGLERQALPLLARATAADPYSPVAFNTHATFLYQHGFDRQAALRLADFRAARPDSAAAQQMGLMLANQSWPALHARATNLNKHTARLRAGTPSAVRYASKAEAQDATTEAFLQALLLAPAQGDLWLDLGTSLFFAGELAESERVYAEGAARVSEHSELAKEAARVAAFPPVRPAFQEHIERFPASEFDEIVLPPHSYGSRAGSADLQAGAEVFGERPRAYVSRSALLPREACEEAVRAAEDWARRNGGWTTQRHHAVPTTDVPLIDLPSVLPWFNDALREGLLPALSSRYPEAAAEIALMRVLDCFLVRYRAGAQARLPTHSDQSLLSFTISLNDPDEYEGGGTWFEALGRSIDAPAAGHVVMFPGKVEHGGNAISAGTRYIIVLFIGYASNRSGRPSGYVLEQLREMAAG